MKALQRYGQYWFVTITPYGKDVEPNVPDKHSVIESFKNLSQSVGIDSVGWRYDPIFISDKYSLERHIHDFEQIAKSLCGYTNTCVISFIDIYKKVRRNFPEAKSVPQDDMLLLGKEFIRIGKQYCMTIRPCAEGDILAPYGADCSGCMTVNTFENALHCKLSVPKRSSNQRSGQCACLLGVDIGAYDTCGHLCKYCYANTNDVLVRKNMKNHDPNSPFLMGGALPGDIIHEAKQQSWIDNQMCFLP
jgi:hypothetical protein